jgi:hypothetical protein
VLLAIAPERLIDRVLEIATPDAVLSQKPLLLNRIRRQGAAVRRPASRSPRGRIPMPIAYGSATSRFPDSSCA